MEDSYRKDAVMDRLKPVIWRVGQILIIGLILAANASAAEFLGSKNSNKYHSLSCTHAQRIKPQNLVIFISPEDAVKSNYVPCKVCKPPLPSTAGTPVKVSPSVEPESPPHQKINGGKSYSCTRVIDGDTIVVNIEGRNEKVRLIGLDTPETVHPNKPVERFGKDASEFTRKMVVGKKVRLEYGWESRDKYGRILAYVYLEDGTFLNAEIIKQGFGFAYTRFPFKYLEEFRQYEREARENGRGLWKEK